jgi:hypothetical protein
MERTLQHPVEIRRIDHIVAAVRDLDEAGDFYCRLGFQVGTRNEHPWGTENRLIQSGVLLFYGPRTRPGFMSVAGRRTQPLRVHRVWSDCAPVSLAIFVLMSLVLHRPQLDLWFSKPALPHSRVDPNFQSPVCMG